MTPDRIDPQARRLVQRVLDRSRDDPGLRRDYLQFVGLSLLCEALAPPWDPQPRATEATDTATPGLHKH